MKDKNEKLTIEYLFGNLGEKGVIFYIKKSIFIVFI